MLKKSLHLLGVLGFVSAMILLIIAPSEANQAPVAHNQSATTNEDTSKAIALAATDTEGNPLAYSIVSTPLHGTLSGMPPNVTYKPATNYNGADSFTFKANDGTVDSNIATVSITVVAVNDPPVAKTQSVTTRINKAKAIALVATDIDADPLTYQIAAQPLQGTLSGTPPSVTYTPAVNYTGSDSFTFKANDGKADSNAAPVSITVTVNHPPVVQNQSATTNEDTAKGITLAATDSDGDPLTYTIISGPSHGTLTGTPPALTYKPTANYNGPEGITFKANDGMADSNVATVSITVTPVNDRPVAQNQSVSTNKNKAKAITLIATDADNDPLTYQIVAQPLHGTLSGTPPSVTYTPSPNYSGSDSFTFKATDGKIDSTAAKVSMTIVNNAPVAQNQSITTNEDTAKTVTLVASDADSDPLTCTISAQPGHGKLTGTPPNVTYTPNANYNGSDSFTFKAYDGKLYSNIAAVSITVMAVNDPPVSNNQSVTLGRNSTIGIKLVATDVDGDLLTYKIVSGPSHGALGGTPPSISYTPVGGYSGSDSFTFKANDGKVDSNAATVTITVVNHAPVAQNQSVTTNEETPKTITRAAIDPDGDPVIYSIVTVASHGELYCPVEWDPDCTYTPNADFSGSDSFTFKAYDGKAYSNVATISIMVTGINDAPVAQNQSVTAVKDGTLAIILSAADVDNDPLTYQIVDHPIHGTLSGTPPTLTYVPEAKYYGPDSFTFKTYDGHIYSNVATVSITVSCIVTTVAGDGIEGYSDTLLNLPSGVAIDASGNLYVADTNNHRIRKVDLNGIITTVAGNGLSGYSGDGGPATQAELYNPFGIAVDTSGNLYVADSLNHRIRKLDRNGTISTFAGNGSSGYGGDGGRATEAELSYPWGVIVDPSGTLYISDSSNNRIRKIDPSGMIVTVAGNGASGYSGDGGLAIQARLDEPLGIAVDASGNLYIADSGNGCIRRVDPNGIITTVAGGGPSDLDGGPAIQAELWKPSGVAVDGSGNLYIADTGNDRIRKVDPSGIIMTIAGNGLYGYKGDEGPANQARLSHPASLIANGSGIYIADSQNNRIRKVDLDGIITTVAGNSGPLATEVHLDSPEGVAADASGNLYISDSDNLVIRKVDANGIISTFAGHGIADCWSEGPATQTGIGYPEGIAVDASGNVYFSDPLCHRIRKVDTNGRLTTVAGSVPSCCYSSYYRGGYGGDGGPATAQEAALNYPEAVAADASGNIYIADTNNHRIRKVDPNGIITTVAGNGSSGHSGDGGPATQAKLWSPAGIAVNGSGNLFIADTGNNRIRKVDPSGTIMTVAGNGSSGYSGDGGQATQASLDLPSGVAVDSLGNLYIGDNWNDRIRKVDRSGIIMTVAGNGQNGYTGDGGPATEARFDSIYQIGLDFWGNLYIADTFNHRVRKVEGLFVPSNGTIKGRVTDSSTAMPLSNVNVTIASGQNGYTTKTDSTGVYAVSGLPPGDFTAAFVTPGYIQQTAGGMLFAGQTLTVDVQLVRIPPLNLIFTSPQDGAIINASPVLVAGNVSNSANVAVNGIQALVSNDTFSISILLYEGSNTLTATATDQYGQTASQSIRVALVTKGNVAGTVTDSATGLPIPSATVSITDSLNLTKTASTDNTGKYTVSGVNQGAFNGSVVKAGYTTYDFSGTMPPGQTVTILAALNPILPVLNNIVVSGISTNSAKITWTTDQLTDSLVDYGTTLSYGNTTNNATLTTSHTILLNSLTPGITYHFKVTSKNSYGFSTSSGDFTFVTSNPPTISAIAISNITPNSATITWTTDQLSDSFVDYGATSSYGNWARDLTLTTSHTILISSLSPGITYHFRVTSTNGNGLSSSSGDLTFKTVTPFITLVINFPQDGGVIHGSDTMLKGTITHAAGSETGVIVNGILAATYGDQFVMNHVPLVAGLNTITAEATDVSGNTLAVSITVNSVSSEQYVKLRAVPESGIPPFDTTFIIESSLDLTNAYIGCSGPETVEFLSSDANGIKARIETDGIYSCTGNVMDKDNNLYQDTIAVTVFSKTEMDTLLRAKWDGMKSSLNNKDIANALDVFLESSREVYQQAFSALLDKLPQIISAMQDIEMIYLKDHVAKYRINRALNIDGTPQTITFYIYFVKDDNGIWRIQQF